MVYRVAAVEYVFGGGRPLCPPGVVMAGKQDIKSCKKDRRKVRNNGKCKIVQGEAAAARRSIRRKVKNALQKDQEPPASGSIPYMY